MKRLLARLGGEGLAARTGRGSILTVLQFGGSNALRLLSNLILTRLLFPEAFGLMALVYVVLAGLQMFSDIGLHASLIQNQRAEEEDFFNTAWTLQIIRGALLSLAMVVAGPAAAWFYGEPALLYLIPVAGLTAVIAGFRPTKIILANRNMQLGRNTAVTLTNQFLTMLVTVVLAWLMQSVWALVLGNIIGGVLQNLMIQAWIPGPSNRLRWDRSAARQLIGFGTFVFISTFATFLVQNADKAILGKFITLEALGIYTVALTFASLPRMLMSTLSFRVVFPLYSQRQPDRSAEHRRKINRARHAMTGLVMGGSLLLVLIGEPLIRFLYDARYDDAAPYAVLVALGFMPLLITISYDTILLARGRSDLHAVMKVSQAVLNTLILYVMIREFGLVGAALAPMLSAALYYPVMVVMTRRFGAWDPVHDALWFMVVLATSAFVYWRVGDRLAELSLGQV